MKQQLPHLFYNDKVIEELDNKMTRMNCPHSVVTYTTLIRAYGKIQNFTLVHNTYKKLIQDKTVEINLIAYNSMLDACVQCEKYEYMEQVFSHILSSSQQIEPDLITYSTLIKGLCRAGYISKALELYHQLNKKSMELDEMLYNSLLDGIAKSPGNWHHVDPLIADMKSRNIKFSNYSYSILIKIYTKTKAVEKALDLYDEMKVTGVPPGVIVYTCLLQICIKHKMIDRALVIYNEMRRAGVEPDHVVYNTIINGCIYSGKFQQACDILYESISRNVRLADDIYNNTLRNMLTHRKLSLSQKHMYSTYICNYIALYKIKVSQEYYSQVLQNFVLQSPAMYSYYSGSYYPQYSPYYDAIIVIININN